MTFHLNVTLISAAALVIAPFVGATPGLSQSASLGPFAGLSGYWSGAGVVTMSNGSAERIRCKAVYAVNDKGDALNQSLRCASDSYRLEINGNVIFSGGAISGAWGEATRRATGNIVGHASNGEIQARVDGAGFSAGLQVHFHGEHQSVSIRPDVGAEVANVIITMRKG